MSFEKPKRSSNRAKMSVFYMKIEVRLTVADDIK